MNQTASDLLVVNAGDQRCLQVAASAASRIGVFGLEEPGEVSRRAERVLGSAPFVAGGVSGGWLGTTSSRQIVRVEDIRLIGSHNRENVLAALLAVDEVAPDLKAGPGVLSAALACFKAPGHRTAPVADIEGVAYVNDSKATNPAATLSALRDLRKVILIAGGRSKGLDLGALRAAQDRLVGVVAMGEAAGELEEIFAGADVQRAENVEEAVQIASKLAEPGDTVLLSPACSSLDQYRDYAERGRRFVEAVNAIKR